MQSTIIPQTLSNLAVIVLGWTVLWGPKVVVQGVMWKHMIQM